MPEHTRLSYLVGLPEGGNLGAAMDEAMRAVEAYNSELKDVLPKGYQRVEKSTLVELLRLFAPLPRLLSGDAFGLIYEDFLSNFAAAEGRLGGEFFTPYSIVRLIVEVIEPFHGRVFDPACGSGGMFVQCAKFVERHQRSASRDGELTVMLPTETDSHGGDDQIGQGHAGVPDAVADNFVPQAGGRPGGDVAYGVGSEVDPVAGGVHGSIQPPNDVHWRAVAAARQDLCS
ncbi:MAG: N-6 DNA methylase [Nocardioidaceae bacterium]